MSSNVSIKRRKREEKREDFLLSLSGGYSYFPNDVAALL